MRCLVPLVLCACRGAVPVDTTDTRPVDTDVDTDTEWLGFLPRSFGPTDAVFAVDGSGRAVAWNDPGGPTRPVSVTFVLADATVGAEGFHADNSCTVTFEHPGPIPEAAWADGLSAWTAFELPADATATDDCARLELPPEWADGAEAVLRRWRWGFGVGPLAASAEAVLRADLGDGYAAIEPLVLGGGTYWSGLVEIENLPNEEWPDGWVDTAVAFAYDLNPVTLERRLDGGAPVPIPASEVPSGPGVRPAEFDLQTTTLLTPADLLLRVP